MNTVNSSPSRGRQKIFLSIVGLGLLGLLLWATFSFAASDWRGARVARVVSILIALATLIRMGWVILHRDSKARWLSLAVVLEWLGGAILFLPSVELRLKNGMCAPALEVGKSFELAGIFFGTTATIWLAAGAWLVKTEREELAKPSGKTTRLNLIAGLISSAHQQVALGLMTALIGLGATMVSTGWEVYSKVNGIEEPKQIHCKPKSSW